MTKTQLLETLVRQQVVNAYVAFDLGPCPSTSDGHRVRVPASPRHARRIFRASWDDGILTRMDHVGNKWLAMLPGRFRWTLHNLIAHPLSEVLFQVGLGEWGNRLHDATIPRHEPGTGRG